MTSQRAAWLVLVSYTWTALIITALLAPVGILFYNLAPGTVVDNLISGFAGFFGVSGIVALAVVGIWSTEGTPPKRTENKLHRWERRALEMEYVNRYNDPEYAEFIDRKLRGHYG